MRRFLCWSVCVSAIFAGEVTVTVGPDSSPGPIIPQQVPPAPDEQFYEAASDSASDQCPPEAPGAIPKFNGFSMFRARSDEGAPGSGGHGFPHFSQPSHRYGHWYRPRAATLTASERCQPDSFRPRGFGHLFARPCDGYRMDYAPSTLHGGESLYGPAYSARQPDPRCDDCDHAEKHKR
jgi:hypothetical protein